MNDKKKNAVIDKNSILKLIENHTSNYNEEKVFIKKTLSFVNSYDNLFGRDNTFGQITASSWILNPKSTHILLIKHKKIGLWFQPGGHVEQEDDSIQQASERELIEETGLINTQLISDQLFDVDVHKIPEHKSVGAHWHYDFRFLFRSESMDVIADKEEISNFKWIDIKNALMNQDEYRNVNRLLLKTDDFLQATQ